MAAGAAFTSYGDELQVCDMYADGQGAWACLYKFVWNGQGTFIKSVYAGGKGNCRTNTADVPEGTVVWIKLCMVKNDVHWRCVWSQSGSA